MQRQIEVIAACDGALPGRPDEPMEIGAPRLETGGDHLGAMFPLRDRDGFASSSDPPERGIVRHLDPQSGRGLGGDEASPQGHVGLARLAAGNAVRETANTPGQERRGPVRQPCPSDSEAEQLPPVDRPQHHFLLRSPRHWDYGYLCSMSSSARGGALVLDLAGRTSSQTGDPRSPMGAGT